MNCSSAGKYPLNLTQSDIFFDCIKFGNNSNFNVGGYIRLGKIDISRLIEAHRRLIRESEIFGLRISECEGEVFQHINDSRTLEIQHLDLRGEHSKYNDVNDILDGFMSKPIAPLDNELFCAYLVSLDDDSHWYVGIAHHLMMDGWSFANWARRLGLLYNGESTPVSQDKSWRDVCFEDQVYLKSDRLIKDQTFWKGKKGLSDGRFLKLRYGEPSAHERRSERYIYKFEESFISELKDFSKKIGSSVPNVFIGLFSTYFAMTYSRSAISVGIPVHNRRSKVEKQMLGAFFSVNPELIEWPADGSFVDVVEDIGKRQRESYRHKRYPIGRITSDLNMQGEHRPLYDIAINFLKLDSKLEINDTECDLVYLSNKSDATPMSLTIWEYGVNLPTELHLDYNLNYFAEKEIRPLIDSIMQFGRALLSNSQAPLRKISILSEKQFEAFNYEVNNTSLNFEHDLSISDLFEKQVIGAPNASALLFENKELSYQELNELANKIAHLLSENGVRHGDLVGVCVERSPQMVASLLAVLKLGAAYVPIDISHPISRIDYLLNNAELRFVLTQSELAVVFSTETPRTIICVGHDYQDSLADYSTLNPVSPYQGSEQIAYVNYTSGSTGDPKGVKITHRNVVNFFAALNHYFPVSNKQNCWLAITSINFDISVLELLWTLCNREKVVIQADRPVPYGQVDYMEFSLFYFSAGTPNDIENRYKILLEGAVFADLNDLAAVWLPERHFSEFGELYPNPAIAAAAVAQATNRIKIRAGSVVLPLHDTIRVAEEWSMVDNFSNGRVELSIASGWHPNDFVFYPDNYSHRHQITRDKLNELHQLWRGDTIIRKNGLGNEIRLQTRPRPVQTNLPIWITAAGNPETFRYAGSIGANLLTHMLGQNKEDLKENISLYHNALEEAGYTRSEGRVALMLHTFIGNAETDIKGIVEAPFKGYLAHSVNLLKPIADELDLDMDSHIESILDVAFNRYFYTSGLFGSPESCLPMIEELLSFGVSEIACLTDFGIETETVIQQLPYLAELKKLGQRKAAQQKVLAARTLKNWSPFENINKYGVTHLQCTPHFIKPALENTEETKCLKKLEALLIGGEATPPGIAQNLLQALPAKIYNMYGPTETTIWSAISEIKSADVLIGKPIANTQFYVLNQSGQCVPEGVPGELCIAGEGVSKGYLKRPEQTAKQFIDNPFNPTKDNKLYKTGDLVRYIANSGFEFIQRIDKQIKVRGVRIEIADIQRQFLKVSHIQSCEILFDSEQLHAFVVLIAKSAGMLNGNPTQAKTRILDDVRTRLPEVMIPSTLTILQQFPLTVNGKVDRKSLLLAIDKVDIGALIIDEPETAIEKKLAILWCEVLGLKQVGRNQNLFSIGGNSLLALRLLARIKEDLNLDHTALQLSDIFDSPTISSIAEKVYDSSRFARLQQVHHEMAEEKVEVEEGFL